MNCPLRERKRNDDSLRDLAVGDVTPLKSRDPTFCQRGGACASISHRGSCRTWNSSRSLPGWGYGVAGDGWVGWVEWCNWMTSSTDSSACASVNIFQLRICRDFKQTMPGFILWGFWVFWKLFLVLANRVGRTWDSLAGFIYFLHFFSFVCVCAGMDATFGGATRSLCSNETENNSIEIDDGIE